MSAVQEEQRAIVDECLLNLLNVNKGDTLHNVLTVAGYTMKKLRKFLKERPPDKLAEYEYEGEKLKDLIDEETLYELGVLYPFFRYAQNYWGSLGSIGFEDEDALDESIV